MRQILMQDWITIRGVAAGNPVAQDPSQWLNTSPYQDMTFVVDVREISPAGAGCTLVLETAPIRDETLFQTGVIKSLSNSLGTLGVGLNNVTSLLVGAPNIPIAHWTRWRLLAAAGGVWDITFRIWASGNTLAG
jgi:hypothetical protein